MHPDKICDNCGECENRCQLDPQKICDNCFKCLEIDAKPYAEIKISGVYLDDHVPDTEDEEDSPAAPDLEGGKYILDSDETWREETRIHVKTMKHASASRPKRDCGGR